MEQKFALQHLMWTHNKI